jgi:hypothetical protein
MSDQDWKSQIAELRKRIEFLESKAICDSIARKELRTYGKTHVKGLLGAASGEFRSAIGRLWRDYRKFFEIQSFHDTLLIHHGLAIQFINEWKLKGNKKANRANG